MVPKSVVDTLITSIRNENGHLDLNTIGLRSRVGKGACQGAFCGPRVTSYLYDKDILSGESGRQFNGEKSALEIEVIMGLWQTDAC